MTILETEFKKHVNDFMMIQSMNDANSMQHEEARRMAMKAVKSRLDEIQRKNRLDIYCLDFFFLTETFVKYRVKVTDTFLSKHLVEISKALPNISLETQVDRNLA